MGARQTGKSTLVQLIADGRAVEMRNLDRPEDLRAAESDPNAT